jgi:hypothetical protein
MPSSYRKVNKIQIKVIHPQLLQAILAGFNNMPMIRVRCITVKPTINNSESRKTTAIEKDMIYDKSLCFPGE